MGAPAILALKSRLKSIAAGRDSHTAIRAAVGRASTGVELKNLSTPGLFCHLRLGNYQIKLVQTPASEPILNATVDKPA